MLRSIRIGTSGYSFEDWVGVIYPPDLPQKAWLSYYAREFDTVEINSTYYRIPSPYMMAALVKKVDPKKFIFTVKVPKEMTHERGKFEETVGPFLEAIEPLRAAGCLGSVLAQFPYSFKRWAEGSSAHLLKLREAIPKDIPVHVEFRNVGWYRPEVFDFLAAHDLGFVNVDLPPLEGLPQEKTSIVTNGIAYFRFHGRNAAKWWEPESSGERYDYLYSEEELEEWIPAILEAARRAKMTFIFMNNCHRGKSAINAVQLQRRLEVRSPQDRAAWEGLERRLFG